MTPDGQFKVVGEHARGGLTGGGLRVPVHVGARKVEVVGRGCAANKAKSPQQSPIHRRDVVNRLTRPVSFTPMLQMYLSTMEDVFKQESVTELKGRVQRAKQVVITAHRSPDGDAIGSSLALQHLLSCLDVSSQVIMPDGYPDFLTWLPGQENVRFHDADPEGCDTALLGRMWCLPGLQRAVARRGPWACRGDSCISSGHVCGRHRPPPTAGRFRRFAVV